MPTNEERPPAASRVHIIGEDERDIILAVRIEKETLAASVNFITAIFELANLIAR